MITVLKLNQCPKIDINKIDYSKMIVDKFGDKYNITLCFFGGLSQTSKEKILKLVGNVPHVFETVNDQLSKKKIPTTEKNTQTDVILKKRKRESGTDITIECCKFKYNCNCINSFNYFLMNIDGISIPAHLKKTNDSVILYIHNYHYQIDDYMKSKINEYIANNGIQYVDKYKLCYNKCDNVFHDVVFENGEIIQYHHSY